MIYEYVVATILTKMHGLRVTCNGETLDFFEYRLPSESSIEEIAKELASHLRYFGILDLL